MSCHESRTIQRKNNPLKNNSLVQTTPMKPIARSSLKPLSVLCLALGYSLPGVAAPAVDLPDAGRTLQENTPAVEAPRSAPVLNLEAPIVSEGPAGGASITLESVTFSGNSLYSEAALLAVLGPVSGKTYDLSGLRKLSNQITSFYRAQGYPFARAYLSPQPMSDGKLVIAVVEGKYGEVRATGDEAMAAAAQKFLAPLKPGLVIMSSVLERAALIIDDLPGVKAVPVIRPGQQVGTGDLDVRVTRESQFAGALGLDNHGNRFTGAVRATANLEINSPILFGDQITLRGLYTEENLWFGALGYNLPLGGSGLRGQLEYAHTYYELGKEFASLDASGTAKVSTVGVSYPIIRSQNANLAISGTWQHKQLQDNNPASSDRKSSDGLPVTLNFDLRDSLAGGGLTYGSARWTHGTLDLKGALKTVDQSTAQTDGSFNKFNIEASRLQTLPAGFSLFARASAQWSTDNLDSSEGFGLGGAGGVRAYPSGEAFGDEGWLAQLELRYKINAFTPYAFHDSGWIKVNHEPWAPGVNTRSISGAGLGVRFNQGAWNADASLAWRTHGGKPESDTKDENPRFWLKAGYQF